jgi:hypothetical protein
VYEEHGEKILPAVRGEFDILDWLVKVEVM